jgi:hypothetical protein
VRGLALTRDDAELLRETAALFDGIYLLCRRQNESRVQ